MATRSRRCGKAKGARILMIPASRTDVAERRSLLREIDQLMGRIRKGGKEVDEGLVRAKEAIEDEKNHLLIVRSRWGDLLGSLSYTFPDAGSIRVDYIGLSVHRCGLGTRLMEAVAAIAVKGNRRILLTAEKDAKGFFRAMGMVLREEYPDGNGVFELAGEDLRRLAAGSRVHRDSSLSP